MWPYYPELMAAPVPRYTSFPTAAEFGDSVGGSDMARALDKVQKDEPVSLYLHIPYCREICWYCGCNTGAANRAQRLSAYLDTLGQEVDLIADRLNGRGRIGRIAFGGGSPNAISPEQFDALVERLHERFSLNQTEWSIELDPRGFKPQWAAALARHGITRASLGVQTFDSRIQAAIGRVQSTETIACVVSQLRAAGVSSLNFDLMYGLPGQGLDELNASIDTALTLRPDRLAVFGYAHVPHLIPRQRRIDASALPDAALRFDMARMAYDRLTRNGYVPIGFDHFALPGDPLAIAAGADRLHRNFQGFTDDPAGTLIGMGASAISSFPDLLIQNEKNSGRYQLRIGAGQYAGNRGIRRDVHDRARGTAIEQLLCTGRADCGTLPEKSLLRQRLAHFEQHGLIDWRGDMLHLTEAARPYARTIAAALDPYRAQSTVKFSSAV